MKERRIIAAITDNFGLGRNNELLYKISVDMQHFKELTLGNVVIMGRKTYESIGSKPLKCRNNIVVTSQGIDIPDSEINNLFQVKTLQEAYELAEELDGDKIYVIGGGQLYKEAIDTVDYLDLTRIYDTPGNIDSYFPSNLSDFLPVKRSGRYSHERITYQFVTYQRKDTIAYLKPPYAFAD